MDWLDRAWKSRGTTRGRRTSPTGREGRRTAPRRIEKARGGHYNGALCSSREGAPALWGPRGTSDPWGTPSGGRESST